MIIPDGFEPVVALRSWYLGENGLLLSMNHKVWNPRVAMEAQCERRGAPMGGFSDRVAVEVPGQHTPGEDCSCGIYAAKDVDLALSYFTGSCVIGEVYLWGKIIEGSRGWRAQFAYPKRLYYQTIKPSILDFFGLDKEFPSYIAWQEYQKKRDEKIQETPAPTFADYGVELLPLGISEMKELKV